MCDVLDKVEARGEIRGEARGEARGLARGEENASLAHIRSLMQNLKMDPQQAMDALSIPSEQRAKYESML